MQDLSRGVTGDRAQRSLSKTRGGRKTCWCTDGKVSRDMVLKALIETRSDSHSRKISLAAVDNDPEVGEAVGKEPGEWPLEYFQIFLMIKV